MTAPNVCWLRSSHSRSYGPWDLEAEARPPNLSGGGKLFTKKARGVPWKVLWNMGWLLSSSFGARTNRWPNGWTITIWNYAHYIPAVSGLHNQSSTNILTWEFGSQTPQGWEIAYLVEVGNFQGLLKFGMNIFPILRVD